ncbi:MAG: zinc-dependent metalloprotease [Saprospiraceae bacterium]|nr:zinc-dependent metalloprotease [Saprospiraceae bacterium]
MSKPLNPTSISLFLYFSIFLLFSNFIAAQGTFFSTTAQTKNDLNPVQILRYEKSEFSGVTGAIYFIQVNDFSQQVADQELEIQVPGDAHVYKYHARYVWSPSPVDITWYGDLTDSLGYASLQFKEGELSGYFNMNERDFFIQPLGDDDYILVELEEEDAAICGYNSPDHPTGINDIQTSQVALDRGENCDVKVLVLYTDNAEEKIDNISTFISGLIAQSNQALRNSGITASELTFVLAGKGLLADFVESGIISTDLTTLRTSSTVANLRNYYYADCVMLLTDGDYSSNEGTIYGFTPTCNQDDTKAFSIVEAYAASSRMTFVHELAHQFGCKHSPGNNNGDCEPNFERPHWFHCGGRDRYTIMEAGVKKKQRIPHFSNPEISYHEHPTGTHANSSGSVERDNARQLREQACTIGNYRVSNDLKANIYGDDHWCVSSLGIPIPLVAQVSGGGPGPYTYLWQISNDGINYDPTPLSTTANAIVPMPTTLEAGDVVFVKFTVVSGTGQMYVTYWDIRVLPLESPDCDGGWEGPALHVDPDNISFLFSINPNPIHNYFDIVVLEPGQIVDFSMELYSMLGQLYIRQTFDSRPENRTSYRLDTDHLPDGTYLLRIKSKGIYESHKLVITH